MLRLILLSFLAVSSSVNAISTPQLISSSLAPGCIEYRISGICYWLLCTPFGCKVRTSVKVSHYIPTLVVSSYGDKSPWHEMSFLNITNPLAQGGGNNQQKHAQHKYNLQFYDAEAIGHPALASPLFSRLMSGFGYSCSSSATPFMPYFLSKLDALMWRSGMPESLYPEAMISGLREVGSIAALNMWGNVYPRSGFVTQTDGYKAAAVVAQRVADIITRQGQPHVYQSQIDNRSRGYWPPPAVIENSGTRNHKWQPLVPVSSAACQTFPNATQPIASDGRYSWALWRPYSCCKKRGQTFLFSTDF